MLKRVKEQLQIMNKLDKNNYLRLSTRLNER